MEKKLVEHLVRSEVVSKTTIQRCRLQASMKQSSLVDELALSDEVDQGALARAMADYWGLQFWADARIAAQPQALSLLAFEDAQATGVLPVGAALQEGMITLAVYDVEKAKPAIEQIRRHKGIAPTLLVAPRDRVLAEIERNYREFVELEIRRRYRLDEEEQEAPTREVDLVKDNPFLDLIEESGRGSSKAAEELEQGEEEEDFFGEFSSQQEDGRLAQTVTRRTTISEALQAFENELATKAVEAPQKRAGEVGQGWDLARDEATALYDSPVARRVRSEASDFAKDFEVSGTPIFPGEPGADQVFELSSESADAQEELIRLVNEQRRAILKLERQIGHQKGILQALAEMLIERDLLDRQEIKDRLKALKEEHKRRR